MSIVTVCLATRLFLFGVGQMVNDSDTTLSQLRDDVRQFVQERDWRTFHSPKNLSMALAIEAGELMEHFQWISQQESCNLEPGKRQAVGEEISDVLCYLLALANELDVDMASSFRRKMELNRQKYPVEKYRGRYGDDDPRDVKQLDPIAG